MDIENHSAAVTGHPRISAFRTCLTRLHALSLPPLVRPFSQANAPATPELVTWATDLYAFCLISHARQLLDSFVLLAENGHTAGTYLLSRALFELAGHAVHVTKKVSAATNAGTYDVAWEFLLKATMGSRSMRAVSAWPSPIHVMDDVRALAGFASMAGSENLGKRTEELYDHLSEFCHPNLGAFMQHCEFEQSGDTTYVSMRQSSSGEIPIAQSSFALVATLFAAEKLLAGRHSTISAKVSVARKEFMKNRDRGNPENRPA
jgi:hypothetical protein